MKSFEIASANEIDQEKINQFLHKSYNQTKSTFLKQHRFWWYRGDQNSLVVVKGDDIAAYCALIPTKCSIAKKTYQATWWVDLIVAPKYRGLKIQSMIDLRLRQGENLVLGFPNELAARIHRKHGWGVREDGLVLMLPLKPSKIKSFQAVRGYKGMLIKIASQIVNPGGLMLRRWLEGYKPRSAVSLSSPQSDILVKIFENYCNKDHVTTYRDNEFIRWRYIDSPYRSELKFYLSGTLNDPTHFLISRIIERDGHKVARFLDICGDFNQSEKLRDIIKLAVKDAVSTGVSQITAMAWIPDLISTLKSVGFLVSTKWRFCWHSIDSDIMQMIGDSRCHWSLGDSDNDEPR